MFGLIFLLGAMGPAWAGDAKPAFPVMAPLEQYRIANAATEIALSRTAAPAVISADAGIMTLGDHGYETAVKGKNGFVCMVWRSWTATFDDAEFWNPKLRAPICLNPAAVRSVLPGYLERTKWALAGVPKSEMIVRTRAALAANAFVLPEPGAMGFMMSKDGYVSGADGHWHPHLMIFIAHTEPAAWGANLGGSPVFAAKSNPEPFTTFFVPVTNWSDGTSAALETHRPSDKSTSCDGSCSESFFKLVERARPPFLMGPAGPLVM
jgi:hypothetical protein